MDDRCLDASLRAAAAALFAGNLGSVVRVESQDQEVRGNYSSQSETSSMTANWKIVGRTSTAGCGRVPPLRRREPSYTWITQPWNAYGARRPRARFRTVGNASGVPRSASIRLSGVSSWPLPQQVGAETLSDGRFFANRGIIELVQSTPARNHTCDRVTQSASFRPNAELRLSQEQPFECNRVDIERSCSWAKPACKLRLGLHVAPGDRNAGLAHQ